MCARGPSWKIVSKIELEEACKKDGFARRLEAQIAECRRLILEVINKELADARRTSQHFYYKKQRMLTRIMGYESRLQLHKVHLKERLIWKKLKETRHKIGIE